MHLQQGSSTEEVTLSPAELSQGLAEAREAEPRSLRILSCPFVPVTEGFDSSCLHTGLFTLYGVALKVCCPLSDKLENGSVGQSSKLPWEQRHDSGSLEEAEWPPCLPLHSRQPQLQAWLLRPVGHSHWLAGWQEGPSPRGWCLTSLPSDEGRSGVLTRSALCGQSSDVQTYHLLNSDSNGLGCPHHGCLVIYERTFWFTHRSFI